MPDALPLLPFVLAAEVTDGDGLAGDAVVDLSEYAHPDETLAALDALERMQGSARAELTLVVPAAGAAPVIARVATLDVRVIALDGLDSPEQVATTAQLLDASNNRDTRLVPRLSSGGGLHRCEQLIAASDRVSAIWYAPADLLVDFEDEPADLYLYDSEQPRLASPGWTRSRCLTIARARGVELWGQLDLSFAYDPAPADLTRALRLAALSGFDRIVSRYADSL